jgi:hypothetical protein
MFPGGPIPFNPLQPYSTAQLVQMINALRARVQQLEAALAHVAGESIKIKVGAASIVLKKDGTITLDGKNITVKATGDLVMKDSKIRSN